MTKEYWYEVETAALQIVWDSKRSLEERKEAMKIAFQAKQNALKANW